MASYPKQRSTQTLDAQITRRLEELNIILPDAKDPRHAPGDRWADTVREEKEDLILQR